MLSLFHIVLSCSPWASGAARPTLQLEHVTSQPTSTVGELRTELKKVCYDAGASLRNEFLVDLEKALTTSFEAFPVLANASKCSIAVRMGVAGGPLNTSLKLYTDRTLPLIDTFLSDDEFSVRDIASNSFITGIPKLSHSAVHLLQKMLNDPYEKVRQRVGENTLVQAVSDVGTDAIQLIKAALYVSDKSVREHGARVLGVALRHFGRDVKSFCGNAVRDQSPVVRYAFARYSLDATVGTLGKKAFWMFRNLMDDHTTDVRIAAAEALAKEIRNKSEAGIAILQSAINYSCRNHYEPLSQSKRGPVCRVAAMAAGEPLVAAIETLGDDAFPLLTLALNRMEPEVRKTAAGKPLFLAIQPMSLEDASALIMPTANDSDEGVRAAAGQAAAWVENMKLQRLTDELGMQKVKLAREARTARDAEAEAEKQEKAARAAQANAEKQKQVALDKMQEAVFEKIKADSNEKWRQQDQATLSKQKQEVESALFSVRLKEMELKKETEKMEEEKEEKEYYMKLALGAFISAAVAILPLLAKWLFAAPRGAPAPQNTGERAG